MMKPTDAAGVSNDNYIPVDEDKLKEDQKKELFEVVDKFKRECLKSYSATRCGDVVKKFDFPVPEPLKKFDNKMIDMVHQAVGQAFIDSAPVMTHTVHNAVLKTLGQGMFQGYTGPCYMQPSQMNFPPLGSTTEIVPSASAGRSKEGNGQVSSQTTGVTSLP